MSLQKLTEELREAREKATQGEWKQSQCRDGLHAGKMSNIRCDGKEVVGFRQLYAEHGNVADAAFITLAANKLLRLIECVEVLSSNMKMIKLALPPSDLDWILITETLDQVDQIALGDGK